MVLLKEVSDNSFFKLGGCSLISIHDNEIVSYKVDFHESRIIMIILDADWDSNCTNIEFINVLAHMIETHI